MAELDDIDAPIDPLDEQLTAYLDGEAAANGSPCAGRMFGPRRTNAAPAA